MRLRIVGDGARDVATVPRLVQAILKHHFDCEPTPWREVRLNRSERVPPGLKGHGRKLHYLLRSARNQNFDGVVATVDTDRGERGEKLRQLKEAREADRRKLAPLPTALGEAKPHNEAWLLDDPVAVRQALGLVADAPIPNVQDCPYPKTTLEELHQQSPQAGRAPLDVWPEIAARVDLQRCNHAKVTGFAAFVDEVQAELAPLFGQAS